MIFKTRNERPDTTVVSNVFIKRFLPLAPELAVKVYLCGLMLAGDPDPDSRIEELLGVSENDVQAAAAYLEGMGLVETIPGEEPLVVFKNPEEASFGLNAGGAKYAEFIRDVQAVLGTRALSGQELSRIYDWVEVFGFEREAAVAIVKNCLDRYGTKTTVAYMDKVAKTLAGKGAFTLAEVNEHFRDEEIMTSGAARIRKRWNRRGAPTMDEIALYEKWTKDWGLDEAALDYALGRMTASDNPSFAYLDSVIKGLKDDGNIDSEHIRELSRQEDQLAELTRKLFAAAGIKHRPKVEERAHVREWSTVFLMSDEVLLLAAELSKNDRSQFSRMKAIVNGWHDEGISSVDAAKESYEKNGGFAPSKRRTSRSMNYMQGRKYSEDELKKMGITLGEEFYEDEDK